MNQKYLDDFLLDIKNIREYLKHIELIDKVAIKNKDQDEESIKLFTEHFKQFHIEKKIFEYKAIIISLYGILERYIELWIKDHLNNLPKLVPTYNQLPKNLKESNFNLSIKLILIINENRHAKFDHLKKENILTNLNSCTNETSNFEINSDAFVISSGNLKHRKIIELFKPLDIDLKQMLQKNPEFSDYLSKKFGKNISNLDAGIVYGRIDDLVTRRNDISHGSTIDELLNISAFEEYIEFLEKYATAIFHILVKKELEYASIHLYHKIENVINIFRGEILAFELENYKIRLGEDIIICTSNNNFYKQKILEIQVDKNSYNELEVKNKTKVAVNLGSSITKNQTFYMKKQTTNRDS